MNKCESCGCDIEEGKKECNKCYLDIKQRKPKHLLFCDNPMCFATHIAKKNYIGDVKGEVSE